MFNSYQIIIALFSIGLIVSGIQPHDYFTWFLEVFPAIIGAIVLWSTHSKFTFTKFTYWMILCHCMILFIGAHYTYAEVPAFNFLKETLNQTRNNYDKVGHFAQGFFPAAIVHELFVRKNIIANKRWLNFLIVCVCLSISACYEFLEWLVAILSGQSAEAFLGTQGYVWDTQSDMLYATIGAISMLVLLAKVHRAQIAQLETL
ncbi:MAG: DUF2238 domain-containing protein [Bacteroidia bacterium]